jgi:hypothetical protein
MKRPAPRRREGGNPLAGILLLARGRADGLAMFADSPNAFLASLAPLVAFPLVGAGLMLASGQGLEAVTDFLEVICALLTPAVLSELMARLWGRAEAWLRFATAFNWCQWIMPAALMALLLVFGVARQLGVPDRLAAMGAIGGLAAYALWLHWFLARRGLALSGWRAAGLVLGVNLGTLAVLLAPRLVLMAMARGS